MTRNTLIIIIIIIIIVVVVVVAVVVVVIIIIIIITIIIIIPIIIINGQIDKHSGHHSWSTAWLFRGAERLEELSELEQTRA